MKQILILWILFLFQQSAFAFENFFYVMRADENAAIAQLEKHHARVSGIIPQAYSVHKDGRVAGEVSPAILTFAKKYFVPVHAMVTNYQFDAADVQQFLNHPDAQNKALIFLLLECKKNHLAGVHFDFEMVTLKNKALLSAFFQRAAKMFHDHHLQISFAVSPLQADEKFKSAYQKKLYTVWQGAYDFKLLGSIADFVTLMAYDQHAKGTTPGPIAGIHWVESVIQYALTKIPANKISLGIPTYSGLWYMAMTPSSGSVQIHYDGIGFNVVTYILKKYQPHLHWDNENKIYYTYYETNHVNRYLFIEDANAFKAKLALVKKYHLRGISVFRLGIEDPSIWNYIQGH